MKGRDKAKETGRSFSFVLQNLNTITFLPKSISCECWGGGFTFLIPQCLCVKAHKKECAKKFFTYSVGHFSWLQYAYRNCQLASERRFTSSYLPLTTYFVGKDWCVRTFGSAPFPPLLPGMPRNTEECGIIHTQQ